MAFQTALLFLSLSLVFVRGASALRPDSGGEGLFSLTRADTRLRLTFVASVLPDIYAGTLKSPVQGMTLGPCLVHLHA